jgi:hypothetical protein
MLTYSSSSRYQNQEPISKISYEILPLGGHSVNSLELGRLYILPNVTTGKGFAQKTPVLCMF